MIAVLFLGLAAATVQCPDGSPPPCARGSARAGAPATSVAVLYFDNLSRDSNDAYLADGLTEELITRLGQIERLQVKSRTAVQRYRGRTIDDPAAVGRTLSVAHLVSGSVRRGAGRVRVTVEMTRASSGVRVWGNSYERGANDLMAVETEIAQAIAEGIGGRLAPSERQSLAASITGNPQAYDRFLRGNYALSRRTASDARRAITEFETAVRLDPAMARAWARIGLTYYLFVDWDWRWPELPRDSMLGRGFTATDRALALDSANSDAWMARGLLLTYSEPRSYAGALAAVERAVALDPRNAEAWHQLGGVYSQLLHFPDARRAFERSLELDPLRMITLTNLGLLYRYHHRTADALRILDSAIAGNPDAYYSRMQRAWARLEAADTAGARADLAETLRLTPADGPLDADALAAAVFAALGDSAAARRHAARVVASADAEAPTRYQRAWYAAQALVAIGERERAVEMLSRATADGINLWWIAHDPYLRPLRSDPRFQRMIDEVRPR